MFLGFYIMNSKSIVIVDYGMGNLHSVNKAVALVGGDPVISGDKTVIAGAEKMILPGVGAFGDCMANLEKAGVIPAIKAHIDFLAFSQPSGNQKCRFFQ